MTINKKAEITPLIIDRKKLEPQFESIGSVLQHSPANDVYGNKMII